MYNNDTYKYIRINTLFMLFMCLAKPIYIIPISK